MTWKLIFKFLASTFESFPTLSDWVRDSDLFDAAYVAVAVQPRWFWTVQLLNFTATLIVFYWSEGPHNALPVLRSRSGALATYISAFVYVWLGFLGAISVSFPLFLVQWFAIQSKVQASVLVK